MQPGLVREFHARMSAALNETTVLAGEPVRILEIELFSLPDHDALRCQLTAGSGPATFTFTCTSERSIEENLEDLADFLRQRLAVANRCPV